METFLKLTLFLLVFKGICVNGRSLDPFSMTLEDAKYYLDATSETQEYEVVSPREVETARRKRGADNPFDISEYKFSAFGEDFHLQLTTNRQLTRKGLTVQYVDANGNVDERPLPAEHEDCYKFGRVLSHEGLSRVAVSTCNDGLSGMIKLEGYELFIQKLTDNHTESVRRKRRDLDNPHIVYRRSADQEDVEDDDLESNTTHFCGLERYYHFMESHMEMELPSDLGDAEAGRRRRKREVMCSNGVPYGSRTLELLVVIDSEMVQYHSSMGRDATYYILTLMNTVASSYMHTSLGTAITVKIVQLRVLQSDSVSYNGRTLTVTSDGGDTLRSFCPYQSATNNNNDDDPTHFDNAVLFTRYNLELNGNTNLLGIAQFNGACSRDYACALIEDTGFGSGVVTTHEIGHNLGMEHDGDTRFSDVGANCVDGVNIMSSARTNGPGSFIWSSCSKEQLNTFLCTPWNTCLMDNQQGTETFPLDPTDMPGVRFTGDQQCALINSAAGQVCTRHDDICGHLACMFPSGQCIGTGVAALDGTACGTGKWCFQGNCVESTSQPPITPQPVDGGWSAWTAEPCSVTCGQGVQTQRRECNNPAPQNGGQNCVGSRTETVTCFEEACPTVIHGGWSSWTYGECSVTCGGGQQRLTRTCTNPAPQNGGNDCTGSGVQFINCNTQACPIDGGWSSWQYRECTASCGGGQQLGTRTCTNPAPQNGGSFCTGSNYQYVSCNTQPCAPTPVDGGWSDWTYTPCSQTCGGGTQIRTRTCTNPAPQNNGAPCSGPSTQTGIVCNTQVCVIDGGWSSWGPYGSCSVTCGTGQQSRRRFCNNPVPQNGGQYCSGSSIEYQPCTNQACVVPVDGGWSDWAPFSSCSATCGTGQKTRRRFCNNPVPQNGGQHCTGPSIEFQQCNTQACPVDGGWSDWGPYGSCSATCGTGLQTRQRSCNNPVPQNGGRQCDGPATESQQCNTQVCGSPNQQTVSGSFTGGQFGEYIVVQTIPVGATSVVFTSRNTQYTHMAIKHGSVFVLGEVPGITVPPPGLTQHDYLGTFITHDVSNQVESISIAGPTTVQLIVVVRVIASGQQADISWTYNTDSSTGSEYQWVRREGACSVTCGPGVRTEIIRCALIVNQQEFISNDETFCRNLPRPSPRVESCNEAECPVAPQASWFVGQVDCSGLCGQALGKRGVYCIATSGPRTWQFVDEEQCAHEPRPSETVECPNLPPCVPAAPDNCNTVVSSQGSVDRRISQTGGELCAFTIVAPPDMLINIQFTDINIDCSQGEQLILKDSYSSSDYCASGMTPSRVSTSNVVQIEHKTSLPGHGYHVVYSFVSASHTPSGCDDIFLADSGTIQSPGYPGSYPPNKLCKSYIVAPADMKIVLTFNKLSMYNACWRFTPLLFDFLAIQDYEEDTYSWFCGRFSDSEVRRIQLESSSNRVKLVFRSDDRGTGEGFEANYEFVPRTQ